MAISNSHVWQPFFLLHPSLFSRDGADYRRARDSDVQAGHQPAPSRAVPGLYGNMASGRLEPVGPCSRARRLAGAVCDEATLLPHLLEVQHFSAVLLLHMAAMILGYLWEEDGPALAHADRAGQLIERATGWTLSAVFYLYDSLVRLRACAHQPPSDQERLLQQVAANQEQLSVRAQHAPMNYLHKWYLVEAEHARVLEREGEARVAYDHAIDLAQQHGYIQEVALANELAGRFYLTLGREAVARLYLQAAYRGYFQWGAAGKVTQMETRYAAYVAPDKPWPTPVESPRDGRQRRQQSLTEPRPGDNPESGPGTVERHHPAQAPGDDDGHRHRECRGTTRRVPVGTRRPDPDRGAERCGATRDHGTGPCASRIL